MDTKRLPVYLLLDCSSSMTGEPIEAVKQAIRALLSECKNDPQISETAYFSVIVFDSFARQIIPLTPLASFIEPRLMIGGVSNLKNAVEILKNCIQKELTINEKYQNSSDYRPIVFLMTDGHLTEDCQMQLDVFRKETEIPIIVCAAGSTIIYHNLQKLFDNLLIMNTISYGDFTSRFQWVEMKKA